MKNPCVLRYTDSRRKVADYGSNYRITDFFHDGFNEMFMIKIQITELLMHQITTANRPILITDNFMIHLLTNK